MASNTSDSAHSREEQMEIPRKSARKGTLSLKAKEALLTKLSLDIVVIIAGKLEIQEKMKRKIGGCGDVIILNEMLADLDENEEDVSSIYEKILDLSGSQPADDVSQMYEQFEEDRVGTQDAINGRLDELIALGKRSIKETCEQIKAQSISRSSTPVATMISKSPTPIASKENHACPGSIASISRRSESALSDVEIVASKEESTTIFLAETIAKSIAQNMRAARMAEPPPEVFRGDHLKFEEWLYSFDAYVEGKDFSDAEKMRYLKKYVGGEVENLIGAYCSSRKANAYKKAREELNKRYGDPLKLADNYREKLELWPKIAMGDRAELRRFSDFLTQCLNAMETLPSLRVLNDYKEARKLKEKLPSWMSTRWGREIHRIKKKKQEEPRFEDFVNFMRDEVDILYDPLNENDVKPMKVERKPFEKKSNESRARAFEVKKYVGIVRRCQYCGKNGHEVKFCYEFAKLAIEDRWNFVCNRKLCFCCLEGGHRSAHCQENPCPKCKQRHASCLHQEDKARQGDKKEENPERAVKQVASKVSNKVHTSGLLCMILPVYVRISEGSPEELVYAMLDTQSDASFLTTTLAKKLKSKGIRENLTLTTLTETTNVNTVKHAISVRGKDASEWLDLCAYEQKNIPCNKFQIPCRDHVANFEHLNQLNSEIPPLLDIPVALLIGIDCSAAFIPVDTIVGKSKDQPFAIKTALGWTLCGGKGSTCSGKRNNRIQTADVLSSLEPDFHYKEDDNLMSQDDLKFLGIMNNSIHKDESGYFVMPLPFKKRPNLPCNREEVIKRLNSLKKRFAGDNEYREDYGRYMAKMIEENEAEPVDKDEGKVGQVWYLPHFGTCHRRKPDKLRVVFDCSARYFGQSLSDHLLSGPDMLNKLAGILCRFRQDHIAIVCDIEGMFNRFKVAQADRDFLRFLWFDKEGKIRDYRMTRHLFGATSSPACATFALRKLAKDFSAKYPRASEFVDKNFYVDDGLISVDGVDSAKELIREVREICASGNLRLHKFMSNDPRTLESLPASELSQVMDNFELASGYALGIRWHTSSDQFTFSECDFKSPCTRRGILSTVASIFDPLGWIAPFTLLGKGILQDACKAAQDWDEPIDSDLKRRWLLWVKEAENIHSIRVDRCLKPKSVAVRTELHHFCDGAETGYGACSYVRAILDTGEIKCDLILSKARVAPIKVTTIPRLELQAAVLASELHKFITVEMNLTVDDIYFWTDSKIVLGYINNEVRRYKIFVANRVQRIRNNSPFEKWHYIPSSDNPADIASRGCPLSELSEDWFRGPRFLRNDIPTSYLSKECFNLDENDCELRNIRCQAILKHSTISSRFDKFSSWNTLVKAVAHLKSMVRRRSWIRGDLTVEEIDNAEKFIIQVIQTDIFPAELEDLQKGKNVRDSSSIAKLSPFLQNGILRLGGRAKFSRMLTVEEQHPIILPRFSHVTTIIARHFHEKSYHQGRAFTLGLIRQAGYWIMGGSSVVSSILRNCVVCKKIRGQRCKQVMGELPAERVEPSPPFTHVGLDCFGPYVVKDRRSEIKRWGLLATCLYSRAIHLEVLDDMSTDSFLGALRRIISIRGPIKSIRCDNGSNFVGASNELSKELSMQKVSAILKENSCKFYFNPPTASHMGGLFERQIRTVKSVLRGLLTKYEGLIDTSTLRTVLYEVMAVVNSRPLSVEDMSDPSGTIITPNHLLTGKTLCGGILQTQPMVEFDPEEIYGRHRWRKAQAIAEEFWRVWKSQYLKNIIIRQKWANPDRDLCVGDVVIVDDGETNRGSWKVGIVDEVFPSKDNKIRAAKVRLGNRRLDRFGKSIEPATFLERPIHGLVLLLPSN
jgi:Pao retrotransposon peptidase/Family of unknown function (DUF5641)/Protein of unknown function (DUF1759)